MTNDDYKNYGVADIKRYRAIAAARQSLEQKDSEGAKKSLEKLAESIGVAEKDREAVVSSITSSGQSLEACLKNFEAKYGAAQANSTIGDLFNLYKDNFKSYLNEENYKEAETLFTGKDNANKKYGDLIEKYGKAQEILKSKTGNFSEEQKKKAEKEYKELSKYMTPLQVFENLEVKKIAEPIEKSSIKELLNSLYQKEEETKKAA